MQSVQISKVINNFSYLICILTLAIFLHMYKSSLSLILCMTTIRTLFCKSRWVLIEIALVGKDYRHRSG